MAHLVTYSVGRGAVSPGTKCKGDHPHPPGAEVKNEWHYLYIIPPYTSTALTGTTLPLPRLLLVFEVFHSTESAGYFLKIYVPPGRHRYQPRIRGIAPKWCHWTQFVLKHQSTRKTHLLALLLFFFCHGRVGMSLLGLWLHATRLHTPAYTSMNVEHKWSNNDIQTPS